MQAKELQSLLRRAEPLQHVVVGYDTELQGAIAPHAAKVSGRVSLYGEVHEFETEVDLRRFGSEFDVYQLAKALVSSFEEAAKAVVKQ